MVVLAEEPLVLNAKYLVSYTSCMHQFLQQLAKYGVHVKKKARTDVYFVTDDVSGLKYSASKEWLLMHLEELESTEGYK